MAPGECVAEGMCPDQGSEEVFWKKRCFRKNKLGRERQKDLSRQRKEPGVKGHRGQRTQSRATEATEARVGGWLSFILRAI